MYEVRRLYGRLINLIKQEKEKNHMHFLLFTRTIMYEHEAHLY